MKILFKKFPVTIYSDSIIKDDFYISGYRQIPLVNLGSIAGIKEKKSYVSIKELSFSQAVSLKEFSEFNLTFYRNGHKCYEEIIFLKEEVEKNEVLRNLIRIKRVYDNKSIIRNICCCDISKYKWRCKEIEEGKVNLKKSIFEINIQNKS